MQKTTYPDATPATDSGRPGRALICAAIIVIAGLTVYANSYSGVFLFDDFGPIRNNPSIRSLWPVTDVISGTRRPVVNLTLAVNYALGGLSPRGYHVTNLLIHVAAGLALFGVIRRALRLPGIAPSLRHRAHLLAMLAAVVWIVHPLQTQSVTYVIQRGESLMGLFYLLTLYGTIRGATSGNGLVWYVLAIIACGLGMGTKGVMVTAPIVVLVFDRIFLTDSLATVLRRRWGLYLALAGTWTILYLCGVVTGVLAPDPDATPMVGFGFKEVTPFQYAMTQPEVILHYLRLSAWPQPLCLDYRWPIVTHARDAWMASAIIGGLVLLTVIGLWRRPRLAFLGVWFFAILGPTSSFIPIRDIAFEHRMYLSLAAVVLAGIFIVHTVLGAIRIPAVRRTAAALLALLAIGIYGQMTWSRNRDYHSEEAMWRSVLEVNPTNARAHETLGMVAASEQRFDDALRSLRESVRLAPDETSARTALANTLVALKRRDEALRVFEDAVMLEHPRGGPIQLGMLHFYYGSTLLDAARRRDAIHQLERSIDAFSHARDAGPIMRRAHEKLATALLAEGDATAALDVLEQIRAKDPKRVRITLRMAEILDGSGRPEEALGLLQSSLVQDNLLGTGAVLGQAHALLADLLTRTGDFERARNHVLEACRHDPSNANHRLQLGDLSMKLRRGADAVTAYQQARQLAPDAPAPAVRLAGIALAQGQSDEAERLLESVLGAPREHDDETIREGHLLLATIMARRGEHERAVPHYQRALETNRPNPMALFNYAASLSALGDVEGGIDVLQRAAALAPDDIRIRINLGNLLQRSDRFPEAIAEFTAAIEMPGDQVDPIDRARAGFNLGNALIHLGQVDRAIDAYRRATTFAPSYFNAHLGLGLALERADRLDEAIAAYREALRLEPGQPQAQAALDAALARRRPLDADDSNSDG